MNGSNRSDLPPGNRVTAALLDRWIELVDSSTVASSVNEAVWSLVTDARSPLLQELGDLLATAKTVLAAERVELFRQTGKNWTSVHYSPTLAALDRQLEQVIAQAADSPQQVISAGPLTAVTVVTLPVPCVLVVGKPLSSATAPGHAVADGSLLAVAGLLRLVIGTRGGLAAAMNRNEDLLRLLEWSIQWSSIESTEELLQAIASVATDLLSAERASIFLWDKRRGKLIGRPALGVEGGQLEVDADAGLVGAVLRSGQSQTWTVGDDQESQVNRSVDRRLQYVTRSLVAVRLETAAGQPVGVFEVINKLPPDQRFDARDIERLSELARHAAPALRGNETRQRLAKTRDRLLDDAAANYPILGHSAAMIRLRETIGRVAPTELAVLVLGENGTGKEVVARSLHFQSMRRDQPFVAVNCAALVESLLESELFGHERGAFTDAHQSRPGKFELASGGTLFLDEIGDMSPGGQAKLLRVLEEKVVVRVGGSTPIPVDVRIIAATNQSLADWVVQKRFREDLFFRLNVVSILLPPLRERGGDILLLANHFLSDFAHHIGRPVPALSDSASSALLAHRWPGNVRELRNGMERVSYLVHGPQIEASDLGLERQRTRRQEITGPAGPIHADPPRTDLPRTDPHVVLPADPAGGTLADATHAFQVRWIEAVVAAERGNMTAAAERLGLHRSNLYRKMRQLGMQVAAEDASPDAAPPS